MRFLVHAFLWLMVCLWMTSVYLYEAADFYLFFLFNLLRLPVIMGATYAVCHFVISRNITSPQPRYAKAVLQFLSIFLISTLLDRLISSNEFVKPTLNGELLIFEFLNPIPMLKNAFLLLSIIGLGMVIQFFYDTSKHQKEIFDLKEEKISAELAFLKSQVNPHFLFNMFNNLYSMAERQGSNELAKGLSNMAELMKYLTYESNVPKVPIAKEVTLLQSFIELQRIRLGEEDEVFINFKTTGDFSFVQIAPVMLLPLVENAFKHNVSAGEAIWIDISLKQEKNELIFEVRNKKTKRKLIHSNGGVGLANLRKRLEIIYPQKHELLIQDEEEVFNVALKINIAA